MVWVQHSSERLGSGSDAWRIVFELMPGEGEPLVGKRYGDAFEGTQFEAGMVQNRDVDFGATP